jgi:hypothetical protein
VAAVIFDSSCFTRLFTTLQATLIDLERARRPKNPPQGTGAAEPVLNSSYRSA